MPFLFQATHVSSVSLATTTKSFIKYYTEESATITPTNYDHQMVVVMGRCLYFQMTPTRRYYRSQNVDLFHFTRLRKVLSKTTGIHCVFTKPSSKILDVPQNVTKVGGRLLFATNKIIVKSSENVRTNQVNTDRKSVV